MGCLVGCCYFAPVASRVSPRRASYFFLLRQKKVTKKKASHVRAASRCLALLAAFGTLANSLRSNSASVLIRTLLRCSARPNGGGIPLGSSASRTSPEGLARFAHFAGVGFPHSSRLTPHSSLLIPHSSFLTPHSSRLTPPRHSGSKRRTQTSSFRAQSRNPCLPSRTHRCCDYAQHDGVCRAMVPPHHPHHSPIIPGLIRNLPSSDCQYLAGVDVS